jgi:hypothetical protein
MDAASLQGEVERLLVGQRDGEPKWVYANDGVAAVHEVTTDAKVIGHVMGVLQARAEHEHPYYGAAVELLGYPHYARATRKNTKDALYRHVQEHHMPGSVGR